MPPSPKSSGDIATLGAVHRTIPGTVDASNTFTAANSTVDLRPYTGKWVYLLAEGNNVAMRIGSAALASYAAGWPLKTTDVAAEYFVDPGASTTLNLFGAGAGTLRIGTD